MHNFKSDHEFKEIKNISDISAAYLAGMIDADGTITYSTVRMRKNGTPSTPSPMILVVNTHFELIEWLKETVGYGCAYLTKTKETRPDQNQKNWRPVHRYQLTGRPALELLDRIHSFMIVKKELCDIVSQTKVKGRDYSFRPTAEQDAINTELYNRVRYLNRRIK